MKKITTVTIGLNKTNINFGIIFNDIFPCSFPELKRAIVSKAVSKIYGSTHFPQFQDYDRLQVFRSSTYGNTSVTSVIGYDIKDDDDVYTMMDE